MLGSVGCARRRSTSDAPLSPPAARLYYTSRRSFNLGEHGRSSHIREAQCVANRHTLSRTLTHLAERRPYRWLR